MTDTKNLNKNSSNKSLNDEKITETSQGGTGDISNQRNQPFNKNPNLGGNTSGKTNMTSR